MTRTSRNGLGPQFKTAVLAQAVYVQSDAEIGLFSDKVVVNCAP